MTRRLKAVLVVGLVLVTAAVAWGQFNAPTLYTTRFSANVTNNAATTLTELRAAPGAGLSLYITDIYASSSVISTTTADQYLSLKYGTGTNCATGTTVIWSSYNLAHAAAPPANLQTPIRLPANNALCWMHAATGSKSFTVNGYIAP